MSNLGGSTLYKYEWRKNKFLEKYKNSEVFELEGGKKVTFSISKSIIAEVTANKSTGNLRLLTTTGDEVKFNQLAKTTEFGGKGAESGTVKEDQQLNSLVKQINEAKANESSATLKIKVGSKIFDVYQANSTNGTPKSDFHLEDIKNHEIVWISHKDGSTAKHFQQWGGISEKKEPLIFNHRETQQFITDLKKQFPNGLPPATTLYRHISDKRLKMLAVYGNRFGSAEGQQNVSILLQGEVKLIKTGKYYTVSATHVHYNGDSVDQGGYEPVLMAIFKGDRSDAGVKGTRIVISPILGRKGTEFPIKK